MATNLRVTISDESGEPWAYCGDHGDSDTMKAIIDYIENAEAVDGNEFTVMFALMTDEEVEALTVI